MWERLAARRRNSKLLSPNLFSTSRRRRRRQEESTIRTIEGSGHDGLLLCRAAVWFQYLDIMLLNLPKEITCFAKRRA